MLITLELDSSSIRKKEGYEHNRVYVYRVLKENIMQLKLKPGEKISELKIKNIFNISRSLIREAIVRLVDEFLINVIPQKGTYVSLLDPNLIEDSLFMRLSIEKEVMKIVCSKFFNSEMLINELEIIYKEQKKIIDNLTNDNINNFLILNEKFHSTIFKNIDKIRIWEEIYKFGTHYLRFHILLSLSKINFDFAMKQHINIINAIKNKDYNIAMQMEDNLLENYKVKLKKVYNLYPEYFKYPIS